MHRVLLLDIYIYMPNNPPFSGSCPFFPCPDRYLVEIIDILGHPLPHPCQVIPQQNTGKIKAETGGFSQWTSSKQKIIEEANYVQKTVRNMLQSTEKPKPWIHVPPNQNLGFMFPQTKTLDSFLHHPCHNIKTYPFVGRPNAHPWGIVTQSAILPTLWTCQFGFQYLEELLLVVEPPIWKICASQIGSFPQGVKMKNLWNHHLGCYIIQPKKECNFEKGGKTPLSD